MTRKKLKLAYIANESARKATFKKRKVGFLKKMYELTTLCEVEACAIMFSPYDEQPSVWPNPIVTEQVLGEFRRLPEMEKGKRMMNQEEFLMQRIKKALAHLKKQEKETREKEITGVMLHCLMGENFESLNLLDLNDLGWLVDRNIKEIDHKIEIQWKKARDDPTAVDQATWAALSPLALAPPLALPPPPQPQPQRGTRVGGMENVGMEQLQALQRQPWLMGPVNPKIEMAAGFSDYNLDTSTLWSSSFFHGRI